MKHNSKRYSVFSLIVTAVLLAMMFTQNAHALCSRVMPVCSDMTGWVRDEGCSGEAGQDWYLLGPYVMYKKQNALGNWGHCKAER